VELRTLVSGHHFLCVAWVIVDATHEGTGHDVYTQEGRYRLGREYRARVIFGQPGSRQVEAAEFVSYLHSSATPFLYAVIGLVHSGNYERDLATWQALSLARFALGLPVFARLLGLSPAAGLALLLPCRVWLSALHPDLRVGNVNSFQLARMGLVFWLQSRDAAARFGLLALLWWGRRHAGAAEGMRERVECGQLLGLACVIQILSSPLVRVHYFVLAVPLLVVAFRPWPGSARLGLASLLVLRLLPVLSLLLLLEGPLAGWFASDPGLAANRVWVAAALLLFGVGLWQLRCQYPRSLETRAGSA
jgi:hypothetical protein